MSARHPRKSPQILWIVHRVGRSRGRMLGYVEAPDQDAAVAAAFVEFDIPEADRKHIVVQQVGGD